MRARIRKIGNSSAVIISKPLLSEMGVTEGDDVDMSLVEGQLVLAPLKRRPRAGWAEDSRRVAAVAEEPAWPEFGNDEDSDLQW